MKPLTLAALLVICLTLAHAADAPIVGKWLVRTPEFELFLDTRADGTFVRTMKTGEGEEVTRGKYVLKGAVLEATTQEGEVIKLHCKIAGDEMTLTDDEGNGFAMKRVAAGNAAQPVAVPAGGMLPLPLPGVAPIKTGFPLPSSASGHIVFTRPIMTRLRIPGVIDQDAPIPKLFVMDGNGANQKPFMVGETFTGVHEAHWSPDYSRLAFSSDWKQELSVCVQDIFAANAAGGPAVRLTGNELRGPAPAGYGAITGIIQDNTKSQTWNIEKASGLINITAQGAGVIVHPGQMEDIDIVDKETREKLREERVRRFLIPHVAAGDKVWFRVWTTKTIGNVQFTEVRAGEVTDVGNIGLNEGNYAGSKANLTPDGRYIVGIGHILSEDPNAKHTINDDTGATAETGQLGGVESITVTDTLTGMPVASVDKLQMRALSAKDPAVSPNGQFVACAIGEPFMENLCLVRLQDMLANRPQPQVIAQGQRVLPDAVTTFKGYNISCSSPAWSPDGTKLAFCRFIMGDEINGDIWVVNADGTGLCRLTQVAPNQVAGQPCFSPDGRRIAFSVATGKLGAFKIEHLILLQFTADVFSMDANGGNVQRLTTDGMSSEPAWGL